MPTYTAAAFLSSPAFLKIAAEDALQLIAKANGQTYALTLEALGLQVPNVVRQLEQLLMVAAEHSANEANAGRLWAGQAAVVA